MFDEKIKRLKIIAIAMILLVFVLAGFSSVMEQVKQDRDAAIPTPAPLITDSINSQQEQQQDSEETQNEDNPANDVQHIQEELANQQQPQQNQPQEPNVSEQPKVEIENINQNQEIPQEDKSQEEKAEQKATVSLDDALSEYNKKRYNSAIEKFTNIIQNSSNQDDVKSAKEYVIKSYLGKGRGSDAFSACEKFYIKSKSKDDLKNLLDTAKKTGRPNTAKYYLNSYLKDNPSDKEEFSDYLK